MQSQFYIVVTKTECEPRQHNRFYLKIKVHLLGHSNITSFFQTNDVFIHKFSLAHVRSPLLKIIQYLELFTLF